MQKLIRLTHLLGVVALMLVVERPALAFRADPAANQGATAQPKVTGAAAVPATALAARMKAASARAGIEVTWDRERGTPRMVSGANLLSGLPAAVKGVGVAAMPDLGQQAMSVMSNLAPLYGVADATREFVPQPAQASASGYRHVRMNQQYQGLPVVGGQVLVHFDVKGAARAVNGLYRPVGNLDVAPAVAGADAVAAARADLQAMGKPAGQVTAGPTLVVYARDVKPTLAWQLTVSYDNGLGDVGRWRYWVDARLGTVVKRFNDVPSAVAPPTGAGVGALVTGNVLAGEGGAVTNVTGWSQNGKHYLWHQTNLWYVYNAGGGSHSGDPDAKDFAWRGTNNWGVSDRAEMSTAVAFERIQEYYRTVHGRNSFNDAGAMARANVHYGDRYVNAYYNGVDFTFGDGDGSVATELCVMDVAAHEFQHGVTDYSAGLIYNYTDSGALNESFSDIFGALCEFYSQPDGRAAYPARVAGRADWLMGEDCWKVSTALRDMRDPANAATVGNGGRQPTRYKGTYWDPAGEMHQNDSVQNFFFYLLCEGGSGTNDGTIAYSVPGIGIPSSEKLAYLALTRYMTPDTDYPAAREAWVAAAHETDAAGLTTNAVLPVMMAWGAVGVGSAALLTPPDPFVSGGEPATPPYVPSNKVYTALNPTGSNLTWMIASGGSAWLQITPATLTLEPSSFGAVELSVDQAVAATLDEGTYLETVVFSNNLNQGTTTRLAVLRIGQNYGIRSATYQWVDPVASLHTPVSVVAGASGALPVPFPFTLYGTPFSNLHVSAHGLIGFVNEGLGDDQNADMPSGTVPNGILCPFWDAVDGTRLPGSVYYHVDPVSEAPHRRLIVTWLNVSHASDLATRFSFQVIIPEDVYPGLNNDIVFQYKDVAEGRAGIGSGQSATIGIEDEYGALFRKYSFNGEKWLANETALLFTQLPTPDTTPPSGAIRALGKTGSTVDFEIKFSEAVEGLTPGGLTFATTAPGATLGAISGGGMRYLVAVDNVTSVGRIEVGVMSNAVQDLAGNGNAAFGPAVYVVPLQAANYADDMEGGSALWTASGQDYAYLTTKAWQWGRPNYAAGPAAAHSGSNCWGTILTNDYPNGMNAWVMSAPVVVGDNPVLDFWVWYDLEVWFEVPFDFGYVEVDNGSGWQNVTPGGYYSAFSGDWLHEQIALDNALFGNRTLRVRFRATSDYGGTRAGMYVDDFKVVSERAPGIWVLSYSPTNGAPSTNKPFSVVVYNSSSATYSNLTGTLGCPNAGVAFTGSLPAVYGTLGAGSVATNAGTLRVVLGGAANFDTPAVEVFHQTWSAGLALAQESLPFRIDGIAAYTATNRLTARSVDGVVDWLSRPLRGRGDEESCLFQVIYAGANGVVNAPSFDGQTTGDDRVLYSSGLRRPWGRFGDGGVTADYGQFLKAFDHSLTSGAQVYVRAWDAASFDGAVAYGDSAVFALPMGTAPTNDFGPWVVGTPTQPNRDSNGDSIPDGYCVLHGMDPRDPIAPLAATWAFTQAPMGSGSSLGTAPAGKFKANTPSPSRLFFKGNYLYALDTGYSRIQVWNRYAGSYVGSYGSLGAAAGQFATPIGMALDPRPGTNRFAVVDQGNFRVQVFSFNPDTGGDIAYLFEFGTYGSGDDQFMKPTDVAIAPDGRMYVTDELAGGSLVRVYTDSGGYLSTLATYGATAGSVTKPQGVCVGADGMVVVADTELDRVQAWDASGTHLWTAGSTSTVQLVKPRDVGIGRNGWVYVADTGNSRIVVLRNDGSYVATLGTQGTGLSEDLRMPYSVAPAVDSNIVYVADTYHNRIVTLAAIFDGDGDGMDDIWESLHGLDPNANDAMGDENHNGILNIGEYRLGQDPSAVTTLPIQITGFSIKPPMVRWQTVTTGGIYRIEFSPDTTRMASNSWVSASTVTSGVSGALSVTNLVAPTNRAGYFRVLQVGP